LNWFQEFALPDTDVRQITHEHILHFKIIVSELRINAATSLPLDAARTDDAANRIHPKTAKKKFDTVKTFLRWLVEIGALHTAPGMLIQYKVPKTAASKKRRPFQSLELDQLFSSPLFAGCKSKAKRHIPGDLVLRDDLFWMPLVLLYTGMRLAEPLQIEAQDVHIDLEHPHFDLDSAKVKLKQVMSDRLVPIHPDLIAFGFGEFVRKRQKSAPSERLFRGIVSVGDVGNYYSKVLGKYIDRIGLTDTRLVAHSFRHGFKDALRNAAVPEGEQHFLMGHSNSDAAHNYGSGSNIDVLYNWVAKLDMGLSEEIKISLTSLE